MIARRSLLLGLASLLPLTAPVAVTAQEPVRSEIKIPYTQFVLDNGLTVLVQEDHKAPIVAVNVWYHVGSKNEKPGRTGFAHLFEHLMFNGSENSDTDYFQVLEPLGATDLNGTTNEDRTNYFENVPTSALDAVLWMESDRMGHLLGAITQEKLDEQRGVVQNEKREGDNQPYGRAWDVIAENTYPKGHPYSWPVVGSMEDLDAASLEDVKDWFRTYYGPSNAVLVVAGDIDVETAKRKVQKYFGDIPPGPPITKQETWIAKRTGEHRQIMQDRVPQARVYMVWNVPEYKSEDATSLDLVSDILTSGKTSRLYKRLVYDDQIATSVSASVDAREIGSQFAIVGTARPGEDLAAVESAIREELARLIADGPTAEELLRVQTQYRAGFVRGVERIGGFGGTSDVLARGAVYAGDPAFYQTRLQRVDEATTESLRDAARRWLTDGLFVLEVHPFPQYAAATTGAERSHIPAAGTPPAPRFPAFQTDTLENGLEVILAERHELPLVEMQLALESGYAADPPDRPGLASMVMDMLDEGTTSLGALEISEQLALLGARLGTGANLDQGVVSLSALKSNLDPSLELFADVVRNPSFPEADFERLRKQRMARIQQEKAQPVGMALRVLPPLLYGKGHAYAKPFTGTGTEASVQAMTRDELRAFHDTWFRPEAAKLVVVGDVTMEELKPKLERALRDWKPAPVPTKNVATVPAPEGAHVYLMDRPGAEQSVIFAAQLIPPKANPEEIPFEVMNTVLGGAFISRVNLNLREDKHWSYGAFSFAPDAAGQRPFMIYSPVQTDKTSESMTEILGEVQGIRGPDPVTAEELQKAQDNLILALPGSWETMNEVEGALAELVRFGFPDNYFDTYPGKVRDLTTADLTAVARGFLEPERLTWVVVGDLSKIEEPVRALGLGPVSILNADGVPVDDTGD